MTPSKPLLSARRALIVLASLWVAAGAALAQAPAARTAAPVVASAASASLPTVPGTRYSDKGADTCLSCHDEESDTATHTTAALFKSKHARRIDARSPFAKGGLQCEACHGPGYNHSIKDSKKLPTINSQKPNSFLSTAQRNAPCLSCHQDSARNAWHAEGHGRTELACASCHQMHTAKDPVMAKATEAQVCYRCHTRQRSDFQKVSSHPVRQGRMACSDCHRPHGSSTPAMLAGQTLNQTCFSCHAEKRGPLLWEHAPVAEDCGSCHNGHGSPRPGLLTKSAPLLCQDCHTVAGHPAVARTAAGLPSQGGTGAVFITAGSCMNCHTQVHGSNHPAGAKLMR